MYVVPTIPKISSLDRVNVGQENFRSKPLRVTVSGRLHCELSFRHLMSVEFLLFPTRSNQKNLLYNYDE